MGDVIDFELARMKRDDPEAEAEHEANEARRAANRESDRLEHLEWLKQRAKRKRKKSGEKK